MAASLAVSATSGTGFWRGHVAQGSSFSSEECKSGAVVGHRQRRHRFIRRLTHRNHGMPQVDVLFPLKAIAGDASSSFETGEKQLKGGIADVIGSVKGRTFPTASPSQPVWRKMEALGGRLLMDVRISWAPIVAVSSCLALSLVGPGSLPAIASPVGAIKVYGDLAFNVELGVQLVYLGALLALLGSGSFLVVRQALMRRELENAAKELQERVRSGQATSEEYFELGAVMLRKKFFNLSNKYLEQAIKKWDGDEVELAQVHNALGFSYFSEEKVDQAIAQYEKAVKLQPGYVTAWNNLGDAFEGKKSWASAAQAYEEALKYDPNNRVASSRLNLVRERLDRFRGVVSKSE